MVVSKRKTTLRSLTARLLVLGDKQVGKSASIVRYTTGRYIEEYSRATNDWLYRHSLGLNAKQNSTTSVELLEQKDIQFSNSSNFFASSTSLNSNNINRLNNYNESSNIRSNNYTSSNQQQASLASRVALDQQIDNEMHEKQQMLNKLHWANAYIVIYAINDISTFNKAIKYLNLIANNINSPLDNHQTISSSSNNSTSSSCNSSSCSNLSSFNNNANTFNNQASCNQIGLFNRLSPGNSHQAATCKLSLIHHSNHCTCGSNSLGNKRPILLLGNKRDLEKSGARQVSSNDGRMLAMRHQAMFAEVSIAESNKLIETTMENLIDQIDSTGLHVDHHLSPKRQQQLIINLDTQPKLVKWCPAIELVFSQTCSSPVWAQLVKSQAIGSSIVQSNRVAPSRQETDVRLIKPIGSIARSVENKSSVQPLLATCKTLKKQSATHSDLTINSSKIKPPNTANKIMTSANQKLLNSNRYENLKSSFRRASMAIVSGKTMAKNLTKSTNKPMEKAASNENQNNGEVSQFVRSSLDCVSEPIIEQNSRKVSTNSAPSASSWIRTHIRLSRQDNGKPVVASASDPKLNSDIATGADELGSPPRDRFKKPLFKYNGRRKTVAFQPIETGNSCIELQHGVKKEATSREPNVSIPCNPEEIKRIVEGRANSSGSCSYNSTRCSSGRSSSSLSNADTSYSSLFFLCNSERALSSSGSASVCSSNNSSGHNQQVKPLERRNSRSTLSRTSTSGGSYEESTGIDELLTDSNTTINSGMFYNANTRQRAPRVSKKRNHLVRSVQNTLTNLTRSSSIAAKRSFCSALFKHSTADPPEHVKNISTPVIKQK